MVQYAPVQHTPASPGGAQGFMSREEHAQRMRELNRKRALMRAPKRGFSMTDYQGDAAAPVTVAAAAAVPLPQSPYSHHSGHFVHQATIPEHGYFSPGVATPRAAATPATPATPAAHHQQQQQQRQQQLPQRPKLPPPRRSYSVMDYEPAPPNQPAPSSNLTVLDLPPELHYAVIDQLDPLDSVCFGLAHPRLWAVHRRKHPRVALSARYTGPNDREWAWRGALLPPSNGSNNVSAAAEDGNGSGADLARMRTKGQVYCRKCGISRCELHRHLRGWMPEGWEYCEIRESFGRPPAEGAKASCTRSSPKNPNRCGRHGAARKVAPVST